MLLSQPCPEREAEQAHEAHQDHTKKPMPQCTGTGESTETGEAEPFPAKCSPGYLASTPPSCGNVPPIPLRNFLVSIELVLGT